VERSSSEGGNGAKGSDGGEAGGNMELDAIWTTHITICGLIDKVDNR
jgi:hypothetical protein